MPAPTTDTVRILERALDIACSALSERGRLLDLPCGSGYLSVRAREMGFQVTPADLFPDFFQGGSPLSAIRVDLHESLPFENDTFDAIICCEGIEHVENPWLVLREFHRVMKADGVFVISLPNTVDVRQRIRILRLGHPTHYLPSVKGHINMMGTFGLCHALLMTGFEITEITSARVYRGLRHRLLAKFLRFGKRSGLPESVRAALSSSRVLCGRTAIIGGVAVRGEVIHCVSDDTV